MGNGKKYVRQIYLQDNGLEDADFDMIAAEDIAQIEKWGYQYHSIWEWLGFTTEEIGELSAAIAEEQFRGGDLADVTKEAIQVATLSLKIAKMAKEWMANNAAAAKEDGER
jgi:NTP pyrophosphatase (non-canonical NTP hydrolase)